MDSIGLNLKLALGAQMQTISEADERELEPLFFPATSISCSTSLATFLYDYRTLIEFFLFSVHLADHVDRGAEMASRALLNTGVTTEEERARYQRTLDNKGAAAKKLHGYRRMNSRHLVTTTVDLVLWYASSIIQEAIRRKPEILNSSEQVTFDEIIGLPNRSEIVNYLIDKKINSLSYGGIRQIEKYVLDKLGVGLFSSDEDRALFGVFVELRNVYVHNRGIVNRLFLTRVPKHPKFAFRIGRQYHVDFDEFTLLANTTVRMAIQLDQLIVKKFRIRTRKLSARLQVLGTSS